MSGEGGQSVEVVPAASEEWGVVVDDIGSTDMAESEAQARAWLAAGDGRALVRVVVTEWPCPPASSQGDR